MKKLLLLLFAAAITTAVFIVRNNSGTDVPAYDPPSSVTLYLRSAGRVISLSYEDYLIGCIFGEVSPAYDEEALKAAACAINSRTLCKLRDGKRSFGAQLSDIEHAWMSPEEAEELYVSSYKSYLRKVQNAVRFGMSHALCYQNVLVSAPFCVISTGITENGGSEHPYLTSKQLPSDKDNDEGLSTAAYSEGSVRRILTELSGVSRLPADPSEWFGEAVYSHSGILSEISFGAARITGAQLREAFSLRSAAITVEYTEGRFLFTVRGIGDNLGMSLNAAAEMARSGSTAEEILTYFYSPAELVTIGIS